MVKTAKAEQLKITLTRGLVGKTKHQIAVVRALGLGKFGSSVVHSASPTINGMLRKVDHLVTICPAETTAKSASRTSTEKQDAKQ